MDNFNFMDFMPLTKLNFYYIKRLDFMDILDFMDFLLLTKKQKIHKIEILLYGIFEK